MDKELAELTKQINAEYSKYEYKHDEAMRKRFAANGYRPGVLHMPFIQRLIEQDRQGARDAFMAGVLLGVKIATNSTLDMLEKKR